MALAHRDLVDADHHRRRRSGLCDLGAHILLVQLLDGVPIEIEFSRHVMDRGVATTSAHIDSKTFGVTWVVRQKLQAFALHRPAVAAADPPHLEFEEYAKAAACKIPDHMRSAVVPT